MREIARNYLCYLSLLPIGLEVVQLHSLRAGSLFLNGPNSAILFTAALLVLAVIMWWRHEVNIFGNPWSSMVLVLVMVQIALQWISQPHRADEFGSFSWVLLISLLMILLKIPSSRQAANALSLLVCALMLLTLLGVALALYAPELGASEDPIRGFAHALLPNPMRARGLMNTVGGFGFVAGILTVYGLSRSGWRGAILLAVGIPAVILSDTRGAVVGIIVSCGVLVIGQLAHQRWRAVIKPAVVSVLSAFYLCSYLGENSLVSGLLARIALWNRYDGNQMLQPLGDGSPAALDTLNAASSEEGGLASEGAGRAHNFVVQAAADAGFLGILLVAAITILVGVAAFSAIRQANYTPAILLIYVAIYSSTDYGIDLTRWSIGTTIAVLAVLAIDCRSWPAARQLHSSQGQRSMAGE